MALVDAALHVAPKAAKRKLSPLRKGPCSEPVMDREGDLYGPAGRGSIGIEATSDGVVDSGVELSGLLAATSLDGASARSGGALATEDEKDGDVFVEKNEGTCAGGQNGVEHAAW